MRNSRHTFLNLGKREQHGSKRLVKQPYRPLSTPARFFRSVSLFLSCRLQTPPNFSLCSATPPCVLTLAANRAHMTRWRTANGQRMRPTWYFFFFHPYPIPPLVRRGVAWWSGVQVGEVRVLLRATLTSSMSVVR